MRTQTQLKMFSAGVLITLGTLTTMTAPAQELGARYPKGPVVALPQDVRNSGQARDQALPGTDSPQRVAANHSQKGTTNSIAKTPGGSLSFLPAVPYYSGGFDAFSIAVADVNGDGKPDVLVVNYCIAEINCANGLVGVLLGNGDGTFQPVVTYSSGGTHAESIVVADVNGDGKPDLLVANQCFSHANCADGGIGVLLGNGNGTFGSAVTYSTGLRFTSSVAVADINGDDKPDLVETSDGIVGILLGNGDGTFQPVMNLSVEGDAVTVVDVNGDAKADLFVGNSVGVGVLLGNGDGTFQPEVTYSTGTGASSIALGDVNGDGKLDLATMDGQSGNVSVLLGNGDGTFQPAVTYGGATGLGTPSVAVADVNGDGKPHLVAVTFQMDSKGDGGIVVFLGNGDGTFQPGVAFGSGGYYAWSSAVADVNGDGKPDLLAANLQLSAGQPLKGFVGVLLNNTTLGKSATSTSLTSSLNPSTYGQKVTWTATVTASGSITPTGTVRFMWSGHTIGSATLNTSGVATLTKSNLNADPYPLTAVYGGDANNLPSTSAILNQVVMQATSTAALASSPNPSMLGQAVTFTATISSPTVIPKGPVTFTTGKTVLGTAQLSGGKAKLTISSMSAGSTTVTATYNGNSNIAKSSASVVQTVQ